jgi:hypothetical protein
MRVVPDLGTTLIRHVVVLEQPSSDTTWSWNNLIRYDVFLEQPSSNTTWSWNNPHLMKVVPGTRRV